MGRIKIKQIKKIKKITKIKRFKQTMIFIFIDKLLIWLKSIIDMKFYTKFIYIYIYENKQILRLNKNKI